MDSREEIMRTLNAYSFKFDTGDFEGFAELFTYGEWGLDGGEISKGKDGLLEALENARIYADGTPRTKHLMTNNVLDIDEDAGTASGQCYTTIFQQTDDFPMQVIFSAHYFDEFKKIDGTWWFTKRLMRNPLMGDFTAHHKVPPVG